MQQLIGVILVKKQAELLFLFSIELKLNKSKYAGRIMKVTWKHNLEANYSTDLQYHCQNEGVIM